ncbi:MAG TPA: hypothetical protein DEP46_06720 [Blastocatellia bacterium]|nr:hypothetical protein [Blastocatellia bacterium]
MSTDELATTRCELCTPHITKHPRLTKQTSIAENGNFLVEILCGLIRGSNATLRIFGDDTEFVGVCHDFLPTLIAQNFAIQIIHIMHIIRIFHISRNAIPFRLESKDNGKRREHS